MNTPTEVRQVWMWRTHPRSWFIISTFGDGYLIYRFGISVDEQWFL